MTIAPITAFLYRLAIACWLGGAALFTFVLTPIIFTSYDRDMAGGIVGTLFPGYFHWGVACGVIALVAAFASATIKRRKTAAGLIAAMLVISSLQAWVIEPQAAALKKQIPSFVTTAKDDPHRQEFAKLHGISAGLNLSVIGGGLVLLALL